MRKLSFIWLCNPRVAVDLTVQADYGDYVERVFRYQNGGDNQVIHLEYMTLKWMPTTPARYTQPKITCSEPAAHLNKLVLMNSEGCHPDWFLEFRVLLRAAKFKVATTQLEKLLNPAEEASLADR